MKFVGSTKEYLELQTIEKGNCDVLQDVPESSLTVLWFKSDSNRLVIDGRECIFDTDEIVFLTEFHKVEVDCLADTRFLRFNRPFYCVLNHDADVGCKGILFFGASDLPSVRIGVEDKEIFETLWKMFNLEMKSDDRLQIEMLQMMLKRYLILCARLYKAQTNHPLDRSKSDVIREFNFLVESHFRTKHTVAEYADLLNRSPKTLSNIFLKAGFKTPLKYIQERRMLEARRLLHYSDLQIKEVAYELEYEDLQSFSRFFKNYEGVSPKEFKEKRALQNR